MTRAHPRLSTADWRLSWKLLCSLFIGLDSAPRSGRGGRRFKSCHSDQLSSQLKALWGTIWGTKPSRRCHIRLAYEHSRRLLVSGSNSAPLRRRTVFHISPSICRAVCAAVANSRYVWSEYDRYFVVAPCPLPSVVVVGSRRPPWSFLATRVTVLTELTPSLADILPRPPMSTLPRKAGICMQMRPHCFISPDDHCPIDPIHFTPCSSKLARCVGPLPAIKAGTGWILYQVILRTAMFDLGARGPH
jgi:hypothetical protein